MSYPVERDKLARTRVDLVALGVGECQNRYSELVEQLLTRTEEFEHADWVKSAISPPPVAADQAEAPDGTMTAEIVFFDATNDALRQTVSGYAVTSKAFTASVFLRRLSGDPQNKTTLRIRDAASTEIGAVQLVVPTTWTRFWLHKKFSGTPTGDVVMELVQLAGDTTLTFEIWGANLWRNPGDVDRVVYFPYRRRSDELVTDQQVHASRCSIADQGDGARCFYSRPTCQDPDGFNAGNVWEATPALRGIREYRFCRRDLPLPLAGENVAPLLRKFSWAPAEIDPERSVTVSDRATFEFDDDANPSVWNLRQAGEGALVNTASGQGSFWRRWLAIHKNYANPESYLVRKVGFLEAGLTESGLVERGRYLIRKWAARDRVVTLTCADRLKLTRTQIPAETSDDNVLGADITAGATSIPVTDASEIAEPAPNAATVAPDYVVTIEIEPGTGNAEKCNVTARDLVTNVLTLQRGRWGTTARTHNLGKPFRQVAEFGTEASTPSSEPTGKNPIDVFQELFRYAGLAGSEILGSAFDATRDKWLPSDVTTGYGPLFRRSQVDPVDVEQLAREIRQLTQLMAWTTEDQKLTGKILAPHLPDEAIVTLSDEGSFARGSIEVEDDDEARLTRIVLAYGLNFGEEAEKASDFPHVRVELDVDSEERAFYGDRRLLAILSRWIRADDVTTPMYVTEHLLSLLRRGIRVVGGTVEVKDDDVALGDWVVVDSDHVQDAHGSRLGSKAVVVRKQPIDESRIRLTLFDFGTRPRPWVYAPDGLPAYQSATAAQRAYGFYADDRGQVGTPKVAGYHAT